MRVVSLVEIGTTPIIRVATAEGATDGSGNYYVEKLDGHPVIQSRLSNVTFGAVEYGTVAVRLHNLDEEYSTALRAEVRDLPITLYRKRMDTGAIRTFAGKIEAREFTGEGRVVIAMTTAATALLATEYPRHRVDPQTVGELTEGFDAEATIPVIYGAVREHTPCRYVEAVDTGSELTSYYRYIVCQDLWPLYDSGLGSFPPLVRPYVNSVYWGMGGALVMPPAEYEIEWVAAEPVRITAGFTAVPVLTTPNTGTLTGAYWYRVAAYNRYGLVATSGNVSTGAITNKKVTITWTAVHNAGFYRVWGRPATEGGTYGVLATLGGQNTLTWEDDGSRTPYTAALPDPDFLSPGWVIATDGTPSVPNFVSVIFREPQYGASSQLSPILADVEVTELGPTAYTRGLWLFRGDERNLVSGQVGQEARRLRTSRLLHQWVFKGTYAGGNYLADSAGSSNLSTNGLVAGNLTADGRFGEQALRLTAGDSDGTTGDYAGWPKHAYLVRADSLDLEIDATTSLRIEATVRPAAGTGDRTMSICSKGGAFTIWGWQLLVKEGAATLRLRARDDTEIICRGTSRLSGGWHEVAAEVDRVNGYARIYVDGALEAQEDILGLGTCETTDDNIFYGTFRIGSSESLLQDFAGDIDRVAVLSGFGSPWAFANGKADSGTNALDLPAMWEAPWVPAATATGFDPGTDNFCVQVWFKPNQTHTGSDGVLASKTDGGSGWDVAVADGKASAHVHIPGNSVDLASVGDVRVGAWNLATLTVVREQPGVPGEARLDLNGVLGETVVLSAGSPASVAAASSPFIIGALTLAMSCKFDGLIDEAHVEVGITSSGQGARGLSAHRHCYYLGQRNAVRQLRTVLIGHDFNATIDAASWDAAEDDLAAVADGDSVPDAIKADYAIVEPAQFRVHVAEWLRLRGMRLGVNADGEWTITVDQAAVSVTATVGYLDGHWNNALGRPDWRHTTLAECLKRSQLKYRRRRINDGNQIDRYLAKTAPRSVLTVGSDETAPIETPALRDLTAADIVADYTAKSLALADETCAVALPVEDAWGVTGPGDLARVLDPTAGVADQTRRIVSWEDVGLVARIDTVGWNANLFTYAPAEDAINEQIECVEEQEQVLPEDRPDYSFTYPDPVTGLSAGIDAGGRVLVSWTAPTGANWSDFKVGWRPKPASLASIGLLFVESGTTAETQFVLFGLPSGTLCEVRVQTRNQADLLSTPTVVEITPP